MLKIITTLSVSSFNVAVTSRAGIGTGPTWLYENF
jgi:hypothetical protein